MRFATKILVATVVIASLVTAAVAATNVTGKWNGKMQIDASKLPKPQNEAQKKEMAKGMEQFKKVKMVLNVNTNKTFTMSVTYPDPKAGTKTTKVEGTWTQSGNSLSLTGVKEDGKAITGAGKKPQKLTVSKDGKTMTMAEGMPFGKLVFTR